MRPLELILWLTSLAVLLTLRLPRRWEAARPWLECLPLVVLGVMLAQVVLEQYRWQLVPLYALTGVLVLVGLRRLRGAPAEASRSRRGWVGVVLGLVLLVLAALPPILFPVPVLPEPGGAYRIGTVSFEWTDSARSESYTADPDDTRDLMVQFWYPADHEPSAAAAPWMERLDVAGPVISRYLRLPPFFLDHASLVRTHSFARAPAWAEGAPYPVVIYSHGWNGFRTVNLNQSEALASHGFIAVAVDHTYGAMVTVFADGRVALNNPAALPEGVPDDEYQRASETLEATYASDLRFVLDQLARLNSGAIVSPLAGRLDLAKVGLYGHSTGGGAVVLACGQDPRCRAGLTMDAWLEPVPPAILAQGLAQPFLFMRSQTWAAGPDEPLLDTLYAAGQGDEYRVAIQGTKHYDFTLLPLLTPLAPALGLKGHIEGRRGMGIITSYLLAFFDHYLKGQPAQLLDGPAAAYPEVVFERR
jgi:predicted dienelactone hydrolase